MRSCGSFSNFSIFSNRALTFISNSNSACVKYDLDIFWKHSLFWLMSLLISWSFPPLLHFAKLLTIALEVQALLMSSTWWTLNLKSNPSTLVPEKQHINVISFLLPAPVWAAWESCCSACLQLDLRSAICKKSFNVAAWSRTVFYLKLLRFMQENLHVFIQIMYCKKLLKNSVVVY